MSIDQYLGGRAAWIGSKPVHVAEPIDIISAINWRAPCSMHGKFDRVWLYEKELFSYGPSWPLVVDECLRLLGPRGCLITRTRESGHGTLFELKSMVGRRPCIVSDLVYQEQLPEGDTVTVIDVQRENLAAYTDDSWTIGILSNGAKSSNVHSLAQKLVQLAGDRPLQIVIAGPEKLALPSHVAGSTEAWNDRIGDKLPRIGEKKNWIVRQAHNANVAIFHDRYQVDDNFFTGFSEFGLDFDFASICQRYESGTYYPSYIGFPIRQLRWQQPVFDPSYRTLHDGHFVNGGLIILKRQIANLLNFNSLLLHNEAEDVELGFHLRLHGIVPRMNPHSSAVALGVPDSYTSTFRNVLSRSPPSVPGSLRVVMSRAAPAFWRRLPPSVQQSLRNTRLYVALLRYLYPN